jgi:hypothetical protein
MDFAIVSVSRIVSMVKVRDIKEERAFDYDDVLLWERDIVLTEMSLSAVFLFCGFLAHLAWSVCGK